MFDVSVVVLVWVVVVFAVVVFASWCEVYPCGESAVVVGGEVVDLVFRCWDVTAWLGAYEVF